MYLVDAGDGIAFLNPAAVKVLGHAGEDKLLGRPSRDAIHYRHPDGPAVTGGGPGSSGPRVARS
jgi:PAS domain-containing protein